MSGSRLTVASGDQKIGKRKIGERKFAEGGDWEEEDSVARTN